MRILPKFADYGGDRLWNYPKVAQRGVRKFKIPQKLFSTGGKNSKFDQKFLSMDQKMRNFPKFSLNEGRKNAKIDLNLVSTVGKLRNFNKFSLNGQGKCKVWPNMLSTRSENAKFAQIYCRWSEKTQNSSKVAKRREEKSKIPSKMLNGGEKMWNLPKVVLNGWEKCKIWQKFALNGRENAIIIKNISQRMGKIQNLTKFTLNE